jgi:hypothetical protein
MPPSINSAARMGRITEPRFWDDLDNGFMGILLCGVTAEGRERGWLPIESSLGFALVPGRTLHFGNVDG